MAQNENLFTRLGKLFSSQIVIRKDEEGHYPSRAWYDRGCRCDDCKLIKKISRKKHERVK